MKYESTILKRLIDTYGVVGNPRYISEIIKEFIVRGKERFPNLFTYQSDWLAHIDEFGLNPSYTVSYTGQSIYAPNTLERPVKSAILKGNSLVNLVSQYENSNGVLKATINGTFETNKKYIIRIYNNPFNVKSRQIVVKGATYHYTYFEENRVFIKDLNRNYNQVYVELTKSDGTIPTVDEIAQIKVLVLEYQDGMENWDIPYFEGMQSVKMPVLTTYGKNLFDGDNTMELGAWDESGASVEAKAEIRCKNNFTPFPQGLSDGDTLYIVLSDTTINCDTNMHIYNANRKIVGTVGFYNGGAFTGTKFVNGVGSVTINNVSQCKYFSFRAKSSNVDCRFAIMKNDYSEYEPYKTNILTTPSDLELRGIGDVQDTLDCLTGEVTERIVEIVLDGVNYKTARSVNNTDGTKRFDINFTFEKFVGTNDWVNLTNMKSSVISDKAICVDGYSAQLVHPNRNAIASFNGTLVLFLEDKTILTIEKANEWLQQNPITIQYVLKTPTIKTVELTILDQNGQNVKQLMSFNGGTHFTALSSEGSLLPLVNVSVETDLEETLMMCSLEGYTM